MNRLYCAHRFEHFISTRFRRRSPTRVLGLLTFALTISLSSSIFATIVHAQSGYPERVDHYVNDFAGIIEAHDADVICGMLAALQEEQGVETTVVTINSVHDYASSGTNFEPFATRLFNQWEIGKPGQYNGAMILVAVEDRKVRIELGSRYGTGYDDDAQHIIDTRMLSGFWENQYSTGIVHGTVDLVSLLGGNTEDVVLCSQLATEQTLSGAGSIHRSGFGSAPIASKPVNSPNEANRTRGILAAGALIIVGSGGYILYRKISSGHEELKRRRTHRKNGSPKDDHFDAALHTGYNSTSSGFGSSSFSDGGGASGSW